MEVIAGIIFVFMYMVIVSEKIHRTVAAMLGATSMILLGILSTWIRRGRKESEEELIQELKKTFDVIHAVQAAGRPAV